MTWGELARQILAMPEGFLEEEACVWLPLDFEGGLGDEFPTVRALSGYDVELPISAENPPSMEISGI